MDSNLVKGLSEIERKTLSALTNEYEAYAEIAEKSGIPIDSVRRAASMLIGKQLAMPVNIHKSKAPTLTKEGKRCLTEGLPEKRMLISLKTKDIQSFQEIAQSAGLNTQEFNIAIGLNRKRNNINIAGENNEKKIVLTSIGKESVGKETPEEEALKQIEQGKKVSDQILENLIARGLAEYKERFEEKISITGFGEETRKHSEFRQERSYDIHAPVPEIFGGKKQPYIQFLNIVRRKLTELGFVEMESPLIVHEFYNFDVLFQPQNHPARTWTDTYQLKAPTHGKLADRKSVESIKAAHETGGVSASSGWEYAWLEEIASKVMPAAHGTAHSGRQLTKGVQVPGKYFAIARCFRPDVLDATHLIEFNQTDGFIVGEDLNFTHLLGMLEQFAKEIAGAQEVKFIPDYYPFTEPSVQLSAKHPQLGWVELGGAGMFRPEMIENLGIKGQAIAWGVGIDRLAMFKLGIRDIRYLFSDDLGWLRKTPLVME